MDEVAGWARRERLSIPFDAGEPSVSGPSSRFLLASHHSAKTRNANAFLASPCPVPHLDLLPRPRWPIPRTRLGPGRTPQVCWRGRRRIKCHRRRRKHHRELRPRGHWLVHVRLWVPWGLPCVLVDGQRMPNEKRRLMRPPQVRNELPRLHGSPSRFPRRVHPAHPGAPSTRLWRPRQSPRQGASPLFCRSFTRVASANHSFPPSKKQSLPMLYVTVSNVACIIGYQSPYILIQFGWIVSWFYLRFIKFSEGGEFRGDRSETFAFANWFPPFIQSVRFLLRSGASRKRGGGLGSSPDGCARGASAAHTLTFHSPSPSLPLLLPLHCHLPSSKPHTAPSPDSAITTHPTASQEVRRTRLQDRLRPRHPPPPHPPLDRPRVRWRRKRLHWCPRRRAS